MKTDIGMKWIRELESGRYRKGEGALHALAGTKEDPEQDTFCCLGVLCRMAMDDGVELSRQEIRMEEEDGGRVKRVAYDDEFGSLPDSVREWSGMKTDLGTLKPKDGTETSLADINDVSFSFEPVATAIREHLDAL